MRDYGDVCYVEDNNAINNAAHTNIKDLADVAACNFEVPTVGDATKTLSINVDLT